MSLKKVCIMTARLFDGETEGIKHVSGLVMYNLDVWAVGLIGFKLTKWREIQAYG